MDIIFCPSYWLFEKSHTSSTYKSEINKINSLCQARAFENEIILVYVNAAGKTDRGTKSIGQTQIVSPFPNKTKKLNNNKEKILFTEVDLEQISKA